MVATLTRATAAADPPYDGCLGRAQSRTQTAEGSTVPHATRAGDVLADRYRLVDLLSESGGGRFWRAHDRILERHVALHVIAADDPRAELLLDAAAAPRPSSTRASCGCSTPSGPATAASSSTSGGPAPRSTSCSPSNGPLSPRRGAWMVSEVADSIAAAHAHGVAHGLLSPENVLLDNAGSVRIIGFCVDAALHGMPPGDPQHDVVDLAGLLHATLTAAGPGSRRPAYRGRPRSTAGCSAPAGAAGVPRALDDLCDELLNPRGQSCATPRPRQRPRHPELPGRLRGRPGRAGPGDSGGHPEKNETVVLPAVPEIMARPHPDDWAPPADPVTAARARTRAGTEPQPSSLPPRPGCRSSTTRTTRSRGCAPATSRRPHHRPSRSRRSGRCSPRRPASPSTAPGRRAGGRAVTSTGPSTTSARAAADWPGTGDTHERVPGRNWLRLAMLVAVVLVLVVTMAIAVNLGRGKTPLGAEPDDDPAPRARRRSTRPFPRRRRSRICRPPTSTPRGTARRTPTRPPVPSTATRTRRGRR